MNKAEQFRTFLSYRGEYLFDKSDAKSYLDLRIQPNEDKFYILGIVSDPRGRRTTRDYITNGVTTRTEEWDRDGILFNLQIGKRYRDLVLRGGFLESTGGVGIDYFALNDKLKFSFEAFDFSKERRAHLKAGLEYQLEERLKKVNAALKRIEDGSYGVCSVCSEKIDEKRLEANPLAKNCIEHTEQ